MGRSLNFNGKKYIFGKNSVGPKNEEEKIGNLWKKIGGWVPNNAWNKFSAYLPQMFAPLLYLHFSLWTIVRAGGRAGRSGFFSLQ